MNPFECKIEALGSVAIRSFKLFIKSKLSRILIFINKGLQAVSYW